MSYVEFDYIKINKIHVPIIPIRVRGKDNNWHEIWSYVDSGATYSIFKTQEAERLGINFKHGHMVMVTVGDGGLILVYLHYLNIEIGNNKINAAVGFSEKLGVSFNLLGRQDIFDKFQICFRDIKRKIIFYRER